MAGERVGSGGISEDKNIESVHLISKIVPASVPALCILPESLGSLKKTRSKQPYYVQVPYVRHVEGGNRKNVSIGTYFLKNSA